MKINLSVEQIAASVDAWAQRESWKTVSVAIAEKYHEQGGGGLLPCPDSEQGIRNAIQRVRRIFGLNGKRYHCMASSLADTALAAMPHRQRVELECPDAPELAKARVMESFGCAMAALAISSPNASEKLHRLVGDLQALIPLVELMLSV